MLYGIFADVVVFIHLLWIVFLITGACWGRKFRAVSIVHVSGLGFAVMSQVLGWYCPLTHLEVRLRSHQDILSAYPGSFLAHYAEKLVYLDLSPALIFFLTVVLVAINGLIYVRTWQANGRSPLLKRT